MPRREEIMWHAIGVVVETAHQEGRKGKLFWKVIIKSDKGFNCLYVRQGDLLSVAENLKPGQMIEAAGEITSQMESSNAARPVFLNTTQLIALQ
jgi:hypothetical protein